MNGAPSDQWSSIYYIVSTLLFFFLILFNQRIQVYFWLQEISRALRRLEKMVNDSKMLLLRTFRENGNNRHDLIQKINELLEFYVISPVERDPFGVIRRLEHLLNLQKDKLREIVTSLAPRADDIMIRNISNMVEASVALNTLYRFTRHYSILGRKTKSIYMIMQLEMLLPQIMKSAEAYFSALKAFAHGKPIGDGIGALVASKLLLQAEKKRIEDDTVIAEVPFEGRRLIVIKALGPGGEVGRPGKIIERIVEEERGKVGRIIMIDAALRLEGEKSGEIVEGIGAAIGDPGPEKLRIEEVATRYKIPLDSIIVKESLEEAITTMKKEIAEAADLVIERIKEIVRNRTNIGDVVLIAGIGNSMGIAQ
ncbi:MAG: DUF1512 domain-containing protein [Thermoprotei archaeon]|nr:DUF1512 domain-containing protein [Thermoprotei archaeon]